MRWDELQEGHYYKYVDRYHFGAFHYDGAANLSKYEASDRVLHDIVEIECNSYIIFFPFGSRMFNRYTKIKLSLAYDYVEITEEEYLVILKLVDVFKQSVASVINRKTNET